MNVQLTLNLGINDYPFVAGEPAKWTEGCIHEVSEELGTKLLKRGHAIPAPADVPPGPPVAMRRNRREE